MKIIVIEGPDNTGKNTLINYLLDTYPIVKIIHCGVPKSKEDPFKEQKESFVNISNIAIDEYRKQQTDVLIFNRFYQGEYVYGQIYRKISAESIREFILKLESFLKSNIFEDDLYYVQLNSSSPKLLISNDDGMSLSKANEEKIKREIELFDKIFEISNVRNKHKIYINNGDEFRTREDILEEFKEFIK